MESTKQYYIVEATCKREYRLLAYLVLAVSKSAAGLYAYNLVKFREHWWCFTNISQQPLKTLRIFRNLKIEQCSVIIVYVTYSTRLWALHHPTKVFLHNMLSVYTLY